jgi:hypothetical protein
MSSGSTSSYSIDGRLVSGATPNDGDVLTWVAANGCWQPHPASTIVPGVVNQDIYIDGVSGSDANTGLSKTVPLATIAGMFARYGAVLPVGSQRRVHLAGTGGADPWVTPATQQTYGADEIDLGTNGPIGNRIVFRGPTNMVLGAPTTGPATAALDPVPVIIVDEAEIPPALSPNPAGQRSALQFTVAAPGWTPHDFGVYGQGYKVRITRAAAKVIWECPIADNSADTIIVDTLGLFGVVLATDTVEIVFPAAQIRGATDFGGGVRICSIRGEGAQFIALAALTAASMGHNFERLAFQDTIVEGAFVTFDRCCLTPGIIANTTIKGSAHFKNSMAVQTTTMLNEGGCCYDMTIAASNVPRPDGPADPINQVVCIEGVFYAIQCGNDGTASPGYFVADDNVSCYGSAADGIYCTRGSNFLQRATCVYLGGDSNTGFGIRAQDNSNVTVLAVGGGATQTEILGLTNALRVDGQAGIAYGAGVGAFGEALGYNGLYHDVSLVAGVTTGRMSCIHT